MKTLFKYVLVRPEDKQEVSPGGIVLPDNAERDKPIRGTILEIGDAVTKVELGQQILFKRYAPYEINEEELKKIGIDEKKLLIVEEPDILAIL